METGDVRLVFRNLAFLGDESHWAAVAASLAADQNMFWPFHDYLFANFQGNESGGFHIDRLARDGRSRGPGHGGVQGRPGAGQARERFAEIQAEATADAYALGINATPTVVVNGVPLQAPDFEIGRGGHRHRAGQGGARPRRARTMRPETEAPASTGE